MPDEMSHLRLANHNQLLIVELLPKIDRFSDWITTIAFYKALHVVEAVFATDPSIRHGIDHEKRDRHLKTESRYNKIYRHYRPLKTASMAARYMQDDVTNFSDRFSISQVINELLKHQLHQVEVAAAKLLRNGDKLTRIADIDFGLATPTSPIAHPNPPG